jgi:hypothetical protein
MEVIMPAGFWIPWEIGLSKKREVLLIARSLGVSQREAAAICMEVWEWAEGQSVDGLLHGLTPHDLDSAVNVQGIGTAMETAGWLVVSARAVQFPNWDRFNSRSGKARLMAAERKRAERSRNSHATVTK